MHPSSYEHMRALTEKYLRPDQNLMIADIGSYDVNGSYKPLFGNLNWTYHGVDQAAGPNVDFVLSDPHTLPFSSSSYDVIISGQAFEHMEFFWLVATEVARVMKPGGLFFLIAPSKGHEHRYPMDCWRYYPDGYAAIGRWAGLETLEAKSDLADPASDWGDTVGAFRKPDNWRPMDIHAHLRQRVTELEEHNRALLNSTSWKITAPIREIVRAMKGAQK